MNKIIIVCRTHWNNGRNGVYHACDSNECGLCCDRRLYGIISSIGGSDLWFTLKDCVPYCWCDPEYPLHVLFVSPLIPRYWCVLHSKIGMLTRSWSRCVGWLTSQKTQQSDHKKKKKQQHNLRINHRHAHASMQIEQLIWLISLRDSYIRFFVCISPCTNNVRK